MLKYGIVMWEKMLFYGSGLLIVFLWVIFLFPSPRLSAYLYKWAGPPPEGDLAEVFEKRASDFGEPTAQFNRSVRVLAENPKDPEGLKKLLAAAQSIPEAKNNLGAIRYKEGDQGLAAQLWQQTELVESRHNLGLAYFRGEGVEQDLEKARTLLEETQLPLGRRNLVALELAQPGDAETDLAGGLLFNRGWTAEEQGEIDQAIDLYRQAYNAGYIPAGFNFYLLEKNTPLLGQLVTQHDPKAISLVYRQINSKASRLVVLLEAAKWAGEIRKIKSGLSELNYRYMHSRNSRDKDKLKAAMLPLRRALEPLTAQYQTVMEKLPSSDPKVLEQQDHELVELAQYLPPQWSDPINNLIQAGKARDSIEVTSRLRTTLSRLKEVQANIALMDARPYPPTILEEPALVGPIAGVDSKWWDFASAKEGLGWPIPASISAVWILLAWLLVKNTYQPGPGSKENQAWEEKLTAMARREALEERHLETLGLGKVSSLAQIRSAYYQKSQKIWEKPKVSLSTEEKEVAHEQLTRLQDALDYFERQWSPMEESNPANKKSS